MRTIFEMVTRTSSFALLTKYTSEINPIYYQSNKNQTIRKKEATAGIAKMNINSSLIVALILMGMKFLVATEGAATNLKAEDKIVVRQLEASDVIESMMENQDISNYDQVDLEKAKAWATDPQNLPQDANIDIDEHYVKVSILRDLTIEQAFNSKLLVFRSTSLSRY